MFNDKAMKNIRIFAENCENNIPGFNIILDYSGKKVFLMHHRHNGLLYLLLDGGIRLDELRRWKPRKQASRRGQQAQTKVFKMKSHLLKVIDCFLTEEYEYRKQKQRTVLNSELENVTYIQQAVVNGLEAA